MVNPAVNFPIRGTGDKAWFGWPCDPEMEKLRASYARETDPDKQKQIALAVEEINKQKEFKNLLVVVNVDPA